MDTLITYGIYLIIVVAVIGGGFIVMALLAPKKPPKLRNKLQVYSHRCNTKAFPERYKHL